MGAEVKDVVAEWQGKSKFLGKNLKDGQVLMGGKEDTGRVSPMELLLMGLAGCTGIDVVNILEKKRQPLENFQVKVRGKRAEDYPMVYTEIEVEYLLWGMGLNPKAVEQAIQLSEEKYCSASIMLGKTAKIRSSYRIFKPQEES
jgi:putative redox protein